MLQLYVETEARLSISHVHLMYIHITKDYLLLCDKQLKVLSTKCISKQSYWMEFKGINSFFNIKNIILVILQLISIASYGFTSKGLKFSSLKLVRHSHIINYTILYHLYVEIMYKILIAMMAYRSSCVIGLVHGYI